jgi:hypothetical protein
MADQLLTEQAPDPLNVAEATLALVGLTPVLTGNMPYIGVMKQREILAMPKRIQGLCDDMVNDRLPRKLKMPRDFSYLKLLDVFTGPMSEQAIGQIHGKYQPGLGDQAVEFISLVANCHKHLADMVPISTYDTVLGPVPIQPPGDKLWSFWNRYWVVNDPLIVMTLAQAGALNPEQVATLSEFYPSLYEHIKTGLVQALTKRKLSQASFLSLPPRIDRGMTTLLQRRLVPFGSNKHLVQPDPLQQPPGPVTQSTPSQSLLSPGQKAATV